MELPRWLRTGSVLQQRQKKLWDTNRSISKNVRFRLKSVRFGLVFKAVAKPRFKPMTGIAQMVVCPATD